MKAERIDLAHERDFPLGALTVHPSTREVSQGGLRTVIEPRVMQVLVALSRANGAVVSKDDLTRQCWDGRVVGEDAINRVMSRLRRVAEESGAFRIETVTRVGYRLLTEHSLPQIAAKDALASRNSPTSSPAPRPSRRVVFTLGGGNCSGRNGGWRMVCFS